MKTIAGIDPGIYGAVAIIKDDEVTVYDMPVTGEKKTIDGQEICGILNKHRPSHIFIEKAQSMPKQGIASTGRYMYGAGMIEGICIAYSIPYTLVRPQTWRRIIMSDMGKGKDESIRRAKQLYPKYEGLTKKIHHGRAEAILIAHYGKIKGGE